MFRYTVWYKKLIKRAGFSKCVFQNIRFFWEGTETGCLSTVLNINFELQKYPFKGLQQKVLLQYNCFPSGVTVFKSYLRMSLFPRKVTAALKIFGNM